LLDLQWREPRELAVVDRNVGDAPGAVAREARSGHLAQHARCGVTQALGIALARRRVLRVLDRQLIAVPKPRDRAVLGDDRGNRPVARKGLAPAPPPAGDCDD